MSLPARNIPELIVGLADAFGEKPALINQQGAGLTFADLASQNQHVVEVLNQSGVSRNDRVALVLPQGPELAAAFIGVACGATAAPLNDQYKRDDFKFYLEDLDARALVVLAGEQSPAIAVARDLEIPVIQLKPGADGDGRFMLLGEPKALRGEGGFASDDDIALILHTSGTTSRPKMVPLAHRNLCSSAANIVETLRLDESDRCLNVMPLFHIHGLVASLLASISVGGQTVCTPKFDPDQFFDWLSRFQPSWYSAVPTMHQAILGKAGGEDYSESSLRFIRSSSAALPPSVMEALEACFSVPVIESYGMTEASHQMASNPLPPQERKPGSVGLAAGPEICILDEKGNELDGTNVGEICIRGNNITDGYLNNQEANAGAFTSDGWFRTGDQGYLDEEGYLFLTGRLKEMINRGGENIAPREIDEALMSHPEVAQAVGFAIPHDSLGEDVAAAVILETNSQLDDTALRAYAMEKLADFKVPSRILILDTIPKGPTGKLQRIGLAEKLSEYMTIPYEAPQTEMEVLICETIQEVMGLERVGRNDNFFSLGGDSLRATQIIGRLNQKLSVEFQIEDLFRKPTLFQLAESLEKIVVDQEMEDLAGALEELTEEERRALLNEDSSTK